MRIPRPPGGPLLDESLATPLARPGSRASRAAGWFRWLAAAVGAVLIVVIAYAVWRLNDDRPVTFASAEDHFKYGSTGGERGWRSHPGFGIPYWIWIALPELFPEHLPDQQRGRGYAAFGLMYEDGRNPRFDLPIGMSMRRSQGIDRVYFTCSVCHAGSIREAPGAPRQIVLGMPANTVDFGGLALFLRRTADDERFAAGPMLSEIDRLEDRRDHEARSNAPYHPGPMSVLDKWLFRQAGISMMREQLATLMKRMWFVDFTRWGPGRVDTFGPPKALLGFRMDNAPARELNGIVDFPSVWYQKSRQGMSLHWDGNNCSVDERNLSAAFGTGATPATLDRASLLRIADYLWDQAEPPPFPPERIDATLAGEGEAVYRQFCRSCHGDGRSPFRSPADGTRVGQITPIDEVGTDRSRLDAYTPELAVSQNTLYAGFPRDLEGCREYAEKICRPDLDEAQYRALRERCYPARFTHFRKTHGYANQPLDGLWLRAPYLHNGSVPSLRALLEPAAHRPAVFHIGYDVYDFENVGFVSSGPDAELRGWRFDTRLPGNGNGGHEGPAYGTSLPPRLKLALLEYLKTF